MWTKTDLVGFANALAVTWGSDVYIAGQDSNNDYLVVKYAFANGADFICVGMFDFQIVQDANIAAEVLGSKLNRQRKWFG